MLVPLRTFTKDLKLGFAEVFNATARIAVRQMQAHVAFDRSRVVMSDCTHLCSFKMVPVFAYELERGLWCWRTLVR